MSGDHNMNQKHDGENLLYVAPEQIDTNKLYISPSDDGYRYSTIKVTEYEVDWDKVQTLDDLKRVIRSMGIRFNGDHWIKGVEDLVRVVR